MRLYTEYEITNIIKDFDNGNGLSYDELGEKYNRTPKAIRSKLQSLHVTMNKRYKYTDDDISFLKKNYPIGNWDEIFKRFPNTNKENIYQKMSALEVKQINKDSWTDDEITILKENYIFGDINKICQLLPNRSYKAITTKAKRIGLYTRKYWSNDEKDLLTKVYESTPLDDVVKLFPDKNRNSIIHQAMKLNITSYDKNAWTENEDNYIKNNWILQPDLIMARNLNRTKKAVQARRLQLNLFRRNMDKPTYENLSKYIRGNIQDWKKSSMMACNYKCIFTGNKNFQIHHLYSVSSILDDIIRKNDFKIYDNFSDYSSEELENILIAFKDKQDEYPLGVCVSKNIHVLFHSLYGQYNNIPEQWYQFEKDFKNGLYECEI